jgi:thiamine-monophosphate kinase
LKLFHYPMPGEFEFLEWIRKQSRASAAMVVGVGDDLAAMRWPDGELLLAGVDQAMDGVHFDSGVHSPELVGRKAMNRNLSDCAAMGCLPAAALATVALPVAASMDYAHELYLGMKAAADRFDCPIIGGDTGTWVGKLVVTVTILGRTGGIPPITRSGAKVGDRIYVSGPLGGSILGRHMTFEPRVIMGRQIAPIASAAIDLSDGLSRDLGHICRLSGVGAIVDVDRVPIHADAVELSNRDGVPAIEHALHDGEDYELLFTCAGKPPTEVVKIGEIVGGSGVRVRDSDGNLSSLVPRGWEHTIE